MERPPACVSAYSVEQRRCTKLSPGCKNCYAETMAKRLQAMGAAGYENGFALTLTEGRLKEPADRKKPAVYFVNSMSDTFHEDVPFAYIDRIFATIRQTPQHTYQILTKRAQRMAEYFATRTVPENVWLGVSVEDRRYGLPRIDALRPIPATVRFISAEPLTKTAQVRMCGNSVSPPPMAALIRANYHPEAVFAGQQAA